MADQVLVTYASRTGWTQGVAEEIAKVLSESGYAVEVLKMSEVRDLNPYLAVVIGSAIQDRKWLPEATDFVHANQQILNKKQVAIFSVCMTLGMPNGEKYRQGIMEWVDPVRRLVRPVQEGLFAGGLEIGRIPSAKSRFQFRLSVWMGVWKEGDHRNWPAIREWSAKLIPAFGKS